MTSQEVPGTEGGDSAQTPEENLWRKTAAAIEADGGPKPQEEQGNPPTEEDPHETAKLEAAELEVARAEIERKTEERDSLPEVVAERERVAETLRLADEFLGMIRDLQEKYNIGNGEGDEQELVGLVVRPPEGESSKGKGKTEDEEWECSVSGVSGKVGGISLDMTKHPRRYGEDPTEKTHMVIGAKRNGRANEVSSLVRSWVGEEVIAGGEYKDIKESGYGFIDSSYGSHNTELLSETLRHLIGGIEGLKVDRRIRIGK